MAMRAQERQRIILILQGPCFIFILLSPLMSSGMTLGKHIGKENMLTM